MRSKFIRFKLGLLWPRSNSSESRWQLDTNIYDPLVSNLKKRITRGRSLDSKAQQVRPKDSSLVGEDDIGVDGGKQGARVYGKVRKTRAESAGNPVEASHGARIIHVSTHNSGEGRSEGGYLNTPLPGFSGRVSRWIREIYSYGKGVHYKAEMGCWSEFSRFLSLSEFPVPVRKLYITAASAAQTFARRFLGPMGVWQSDRRVELIVNSDRDDVFLKEFSIRS